MLKITKKVLPTDGFAPWFPSAPVQNMEFMFSLSFWMVSDNVASALLGEFVYWVLQREVSLHFFGSNCRKWSHCFCCLGSGPERNCWYQWSWRCICWRYRLIYFILTCKLNISFNSCLYYIAKIYEFNNF